MTALMFSARLSRLTLVILLALAGLVLTVSRADAVRSGESVSIDDHPWMAGIVTPVEGLCGGTLIDPLWVVTAAHCVRAERNSADTITVILGQSGTPSIEALHERLGVQTIEFHPFLDIALLRLAEPAERPTLPLSMARVSPGDSTYILGWGEVDDESGPAATLQMSSVDVDDGITCDSALQITGTAPNEGMVCTGTGVVPDLSLRGPCHGDSGGPLVWMTDNGPTLAGVVSIANCGGTGFYVRVSTAASAPWLQGVIASSRTPASPARFARADNGALYFIEDGRARKIPDADTFQAAPLNGQDGEWTGYPTEEAILAAYPPGEPIASVRELPQTGPVQTQGNVTTPPGGDAPRQPGLRDGEYVKGSGPIVYIIDDGHKRPFPDWDTFVSRGGDPSQVRTISDAELAAIPNGEAKPSVHTQSPDVSLPTRIALLASETSVQVGTRVTFIAETDRDVGPTPYGIKIERHDGERLAFCTEGSQCSANVEEGSATTWRFRATVENSDGRLMVSEVVSVSWSASSQPSTSTTNSSSTAAQSAPAPSRVSLRASSTSVNSGTRVTLTAETDRDVGPTPYAINIVDGDGNVVGQCGEGTTCRAEVSRSTAGSATYRAKVESTDAVVARAGEVTVSWTAPAASSSSSSSSSSPSSSGTGSSSSSSGSSPSASTTPSPPSISASTTSPSRGSSVTLTLTASRAPASGTRLELLRREGSGAFPESINGLADCRQQSAMVRVCTVTPPSSSTSTYEAAITRGSDIVQHGQTVTIRWR